MDVRSETARLLPNTPVRYPTDGTFELTVRCNLHCKMCLFRHDDSENPDLIAKELTASEWIDMARQAADAGTLQLLITGGEPMLRPDFCEIWEGIYKLGFFITLYTNATMVTPKIMETLKKYPPHKIGITLYGSSPETYGKVCGSEDAFHRAIEGIHTLQTLPSTLDFRTTVIQDNYGDVRAMDDLVKSEFHDSQTITQTRTVTKSVRGACADVESCRLTPEDNVNLALRRSVEAIKSIVGEDDFHEEYVHIEQKKDPEEHTRQQVTLFGCNAGMSSYTISWDGRLLGCQMLGVFSTDARNAGFQTAWEQYPLTVKLPEPNPKCQSCSGAELCQCCVASRYAETNDLSGVPDYVCQDTFIMMSKLSKEE